MPTFPTYFLYFAHPDTEIFVKPGVTHSFLQLIGAPVAWLNTLSGESYCAIRQVGQDVLEAFRSYGAVDMVDAQSIIWTAGAVQQERLEKSGPGSEFKDLFIEFLGSYPTSEVGRQHLAFYGASRQAGAANFAAICAAADRGDDITDAVLLKLLPYADNTRNRNAGAWVHVAPAINGDLKKWFENAGGTRPEDWPQVARAILAFVRRCLDTPDQLAAACAEFAALSYSNGFQAGMLTPILNALRPEEFAIVNGKSRAVISHFSGKEFTQNIQDYPTTNDAGHRLIAEFSETLALGDGLAAGVSHGDRFDMFSHWLVAVKKYHFQKSRYWKIAPGESAWQWAECQEGGFIAIGWDQLGDLSTVDDHKFNEIASELNKSLGWTKKAMNQVWRFAKEIREGDRVVANRGKSELVGIGTVIGPYYFVPGAKLGHRLPVEWNDTTCRQINEPGWSNTLLELERAKFVQLATAPACEEGPPKNPDYPLSQCAVDTGVDETELARWVRAIRRKGQAIFYGPPGTGKTFIAQKLAGHLIGGGDGFADLVQFHPAYAYEDFVQGIRPHTSAGGTLEYPVVPGRFLDFCRKAEACNGPCVLIIDEINRANLARVFGELMYLLEYRDQEIPLAAGEQKFRIPQNVYLIGTMNTADRSIALVDHALRRRFAFLALQPNFDVLRRFHERHPTGFPVDKLIGVLGELNQRIGDRHYEVGISFFLRPDIADHLADVWQMEIEPYLEEYFFDAPGRMSEYRWELIKPRIYPGA
jgi:hypothetical protein